MASTAFRRPVADMQMLMASSKANPLIAHRALNRVIEKYGDITKFAKAYGKESDTHHDKVLNDIHSAFKAKLAKKKMDDGGSADDDAGTSADTPTAATSDQTLGWMQSRGRYSPMNYFDATGSTQGTGDPNPTRLNPQDTAAQTHWQAPNLVQKHDDGGPIVDPGVDMSQYNEASGGTAAPPAAPPPPAASATDAVAGNAGKSWWQDRNKMRDMVTVLSTLQKSQQPPHQTLRPAHYGGTNDYVNGMKNGGALRPGYADGDQVDDPSADPQTTTGGPKYDINWPMFGLSTAAAMMAGGHRSWSRNLGEGLVAGTQNLGAQQKLEMDRAQQAAQQQYYKARGLDMQGQAATRFMQAQQQVSGLAQQLAMMQGDPGYSPQEIKAVKEQYDLQSNLLNQLRPSMTGLRAPPASAAPPPSGGPSSDAPPLPQGALQGQTAYAGSDVGALGGGLGGGSSPGPSAPPPPSALSASAAPSGGGIPPATQIPQTQIPTTQPAPPPSMGMPQQSASGGGGLQEINEQQWRHIVNVARSNAFNPLFKPQAEMAQKAIEDSNKTGVFANPFDGKTYIRPGFGEARAAVARPEEAQKQQFAISTHGAEVAQNVAGELRKETLLTAPGGPRERAAAIETNASNARAAYATGLKLDSEQIPVKDADGNQGYATGRELLAMRGQPNTTNVPDPNTDPNKDGIVTNHGTIIPPPPDKPAYSGPGVAAGPSETRQAALKAWREDADKDYEAIPDITQAQQRIVTIANAFKLIETGYGTTTLATVNAMLKKSGLPAITGDDPAQVQIGLKSAFGEVLDTMKNAKMSRPAFAQVKMATENFAHPDLQPGANMSILAQTYGVLDHLKQSTLDFRDASKAKGNGRKWEDPDDFRAQWMQKNSLQGYIDNAHKLLGPLKGEPQPPPAGMPARTPNNSQQQPAAAAPPTAPAQGAQAAPAQQEPAGATHKAQLNGKPIYAVGGKWVFANGQPVQ